MNDFGKVIDSSDIVIDSSDLDVDEVKVVAISDADFESFGEVILPCQVKTYRRKKRIAALPVNDESYRRILQTRAVNGRKHGEEFVFDLTEAQRKVINRWNEIAAEEQAKDERAFERRMKRLQATHGRIG
tara:strand:+ start:69 stop:458 length:390 start_codon:yes stop_codon:yes gene_type:complete